MNDTTGRARAREAVATQMAAYSWNVSDLARNAAVDVGTVSDFLNGSRWPQQATRSKLARALNWSADSIDLLVRGLEQQANDESVGGADQDDAVLTSLPPEALVGFGAAERAEVIAAAKLSALQTARAIRRRLEDERE